MKLMKTPFRFFFSNDWLNACMITYVEKEYVFLSIIDEKIIEHFLRMKKKNLM